MEPYKLSLRENGYAVIDGFLEEANMRQMRDEAAEIVDRYEVSDSGDTSVFSTRRQEQTTDERFMRSAAGVECFFEEGTLDAQGRLMVDKARAVNKIGHALHEVPGSAFRGLAESDAVKGILKSLGYLSPIAVQSMYIMKGAKLGGVVSKHQDASFLGTGWY
jgi:phytanoyl-CoA hydroxylase